MSKRVQNKIKVAESGMSFVKSRQWSIGDKKNLLKALQTHGHEDYQKICEMLPYKSVSSVKLMIHKIKQKARAKGIETHNTRSALDGWRESGLFDDDTWPIPQALKFISLFEDHPKPEECNGFDFRAAYDYLYRMTLGYPMVHLNPETARKLDELMAEVYKEVWPSSQSEILNYLTKINKKKHTKCYPPKKRPRMENSTIPDEK